MAVRVGPWLPFSCLIRTAQCKCWEPVSNRRCMRCAPTPLASQVGRESSAVPPARPQGPFRRRITERRLILDLRGALIGSQPRALACGPRMRHSALPAGAPAAADLNRTFRARLRLGHAQCVTCFRASDAACQARECPRMPSAAATNPPVAAAAAARRKRLGWIRFQGAARPPSRLPRPSECESVTGVTGDRNRRRVDNLAHDAGS